MEAAIAIDTPNVTPIAAGKKKQESYEKLVHRLSVQSVKKHYDAFVDVPWDEPGNEIRQDDPRFELSEQNTLGATAWYKAQPQAVRAGIGLMDTAGSMKMGVVFENILQRGMLEFAASLPNGAPEFRYAYPEPEGSMERVVSDDKLLQLVLLELGKNLAYRLKY